MIKANMFYCENPSIKNYRDMNLTDIIKEYLYTKGTWDNEGNPCNKEVRPDELIRSAFWLYELKDNATNRMNVKYFCEKRARENLWARETYGVPRIIIPDDIWQECNDYNRRMTNRK